MFDFTGIRPARFVSLEKGRAPTLSDTSTSLSQFRLTAGTLSPGEEGVRNSNVDPSGLDLVIILPRGEERLPL